MYVSRLYSLEYEGSNCCRRRDEEKGGKDARGRRGGQEASQSERGSRRSYTGGKEQMKTQSKEWVG